MTDAASPSRIHGYQKQMRLRGKILYFDRTLTYFTCAIVLAHWHVRRTEARCFFMGPRWLIHPILSYPSKVVVNSIVYIFWFFFVQDVLTIDMLRNELAN